MAELGYQAGQHELLAEQFLKHFPQEVKLAVKEAEKIVETLKKDLKGHQNYLEKSYKNLDKAKLKYIKYQDDLTSSKGSESFPQENKDQILAKEAQTESGKVEYAVQLVKTNKSQSQYYESELPDILGKVEKLCESQYKYFISLMSRWVSLSSILSSDSLDYISGVWPQSRRWLPSYRSARRT